MSEDRGKTTSAGAGGTDATRSRDRSPALASNWEDRVAAAREKRAKILAQRAAGEKKSAVRPAVGAQEGIFPPSLAGKTSRPAPEPRSAEKTNTELNAELPAGPSGQSRETAEPTAKTGEGLEGVAPEILAAKVPDDLIRSSISRRRDTADADGAGTGESAADPVSGDSTRNGVPVFRHPSDRSSASEQSSKPKPREALPPLAAQVPPADPRTRFLAFSEWLDKTSPGIRIAVVAFACCFGLGAGMVLSFGVLSALGWIAPSPQSAALSRTVAPVLSDVPPQVSTRSDFRMLAPVPGAGSDITTPGVSPQTSSPRKTPPLFGAPPADSRPSGLLSPGPLLNTETPGLNTPGQAASVLQISTAVEDKLAYIASAPDRPTRVRFPTDQVPALADRSKIDLWTDLTTPDTPAGLTPEPVPPKAVFASTVFMPSPKLPGTVKGTLPSVTPGARTIPAAFTGIASAGLPPVPQRVAAVLMPSGISPAPALPDLNTKVLFTPDDPSGLPETGAPQERILTLAGKLGLDQNERERFSLVTFAPGSVEDTEIESTRGTLSATGLALGPLNRVSFRVSRTHIRYYFAQDAEVAQAVAAEVGGQARDFTRVSTGAPPGRIEIWMAGTARAVTSPAPRPRTAATTARPAPAAPSAAEQRARARQALRDRLINALRREEYK